MSDEQYFRYEDVRTTAGVQVYLRVYRVLKRTPCGVKLDLGYGLTRFVLDGARRQWACPTDVDAWNAFTARKRRQIKILEARLADARAALVKSPVLPGDDELFSPA